MGKIIIATMKISLLILPVEHSLLKCKVVAVVNANVKV
jgi:hypothetical protein